MMRSLRSPDVVFGTTLAAVVFLFAIWQLNHLGGFRWDWDEGVYLTTARETAKGGVLYRDIFSMSPPLFINSINVAFALGGQSITAGRAVIALYGALGVLAVGLVAYAFNGPLAGMAAAVLLAIAPHYYNLSRVVMGDIPSAAVACLALWATIRYGRGGRAWLAIGGLLLGLGILLKLSAGLVAPAMLAAVLWQDLCRSQSQRLGFCLRQVGLSLAVMSSASLGPIFISALLYPARPMFDQVVGLLFTQSNAFPRDVADNATMILAYLVGVNQGIALNRGLTILAFAGILALAFRSWKATAIALIWLSFVLIAFLNYAPLWDHLLSPILFPLAALSGGAVGELYRRAKQIHWGKELNAMPLLAALVVGTVAYLCDVPAIARTDGRLHKAPERRDLQEMAQFVRDKLSDNDYLITDEPLVAFASGRSIPPDLADCSRVRIQTGQLTQADLIAITKRYSPAAIALTADGRFKMRLPGYVEWVKRQKHYWLAWEQGGEIYLNCHRSSN